VNGHPQYEPDFDLYALGTMEGEERAALESHLASCPHCAAKLEAARGRLALLALWAPAWTPSPAVRKRLMSSLKPLTPRPASPQKLSIPRGIEAPKPWGIWRWLVPSFAGAMIVLVVLCALLFVRNRRLVQQVRDFRFQQQRLKAQVRETQAENAKARAVLDILTSPSTVKVDLAAAEVHPVPQGKALYNPEKGLLFYAAHLPALPDRRTYQLWLVPAKGNPVSAGIFEPDRNGAGSVLLPPLPVGLTAKAFAVTIEPAGGMPQPTGKKVLIGVVSGQPG
jgi:anti-sigma-K factor RskA